jgi:hypothetical protein
MPLLKDTEREQLRQLVKACLLEISKLKMEIKKCQNESSRWKSMESIQIKEIKTLTQNKLIERNKEIASLKDIIKQQNERINELLKIKSYFDALTAKPKQDLTSFQSQIYQLLPDRENTSENLYTHVTGIGFRELSNENFEHVLRNLERKGYLESFNLDEKVLWRKVDK